MKHDSDAVLFPPSRANGPCILLNSDLTKHCCWQESMDFVSAASLEIDGCRILLASIYLPCHSKGDGAVTAAIAEIDALLEDRWVAAPWSFLVFGGDANTEVPSQPHIGPACTGGAWSARSEALAKFVAKWNGTWTSTFNNDTCSYTHLHHVHKSTRVIDYVWCSACSGTDFHATTHVAYHLCIKSDHYPIMVDITLKHGGGRKKPRRKIPWKPKCNFADVRVQNRFAALMDHAVCNDEDQDLSVFSSNIRSAMDFSQNFEAPVFVSADQSIRDQLGPLYLAVDEGVTRSPDILLSKHSTGIRNLSSAPRPPSTSKIVLSAPLVMTKTISLASNLFLWMAIFLFVPRIGKGSFALCTLACTMTPTIVSMSKTAALNIYAPSCLVKTASLFRNSLCMKFLPRADENPRQHQGRILFRGELWLACRLVQSVALWRSSNFVSTGTADTAIS